MWYTLRLTALLALVIMLIPTWPQYAKLAFSLYLEFGIISVFICRQTRIFPMLTVISLGFYLKVLFVMLPGCLEQAVVVAVSALFLIGWMRYLANAWAMVLFQHTRHYLTFARGFLCLWLICVLMLGLVAQGTNKIFVRMANWLIIVLLAMESADNFAYWMVGTMYGLYWMSDVCSPQRLVFLT